MQTPYNSLSRQQQFFRIEHTHMIFLNNMEQAKVQMQNFVN